LRIDWANQSGRGVGIVDTIKSDTKKAVAAGVKFTGANVERRRTRGGYRQRANRHRLSIVENRNPARSAVDRPPHTALGSAKINLI
jgi:hypothetical protein